MLIVVIIKVSLLSNYSLEKIEKTNIYKFRTNIYAEFNSVQFKVIPLRKDLRNTCRMLLNQPLARSMEQTGSPLELKYHPTVAAIVCLIGLGVACTFLFMGRTREELQLDFVIAILPDFYAHISNFVITFEIVLLISFVWLLRGLYIWSFIWLFFVAIVLNLIFETSVWILNTPDTLDAVFGIFGVLLAMVCTLLLKTFGIYEVVKYKPSN